MTDLTAFMSHFYSEIPSVSEPFSGLYSNLEVFLAKGSIQLSRVVLELDTSGAHSLTQIKYVCVPIKSIFCIE